MRKVGDFDNIGFLYQLQGLTGFGQRRFCRLDGCLSLSADSVYLLARDGQLLFSCCGDLRTFSGLFGLGVDGYDDGFDVRFLLGNHCVLDGEFFL